MSQDEIDALKNASTIIERFGGIRPMAAKVGAPVTTVQGWKKRDVIPGSRRDDVLRAANENNIDLSDITASAPKMSSAPYIPSPFSREEREEEASSVTKDDDVKITVEPLVRPQPKDLPPSFSARPDNTHDDLMAAIVAGQKKAVRASFWTMLGFTALLGGVAALFLLPSAKKIEKHDAQIANLEGKVGEIDKDVQEVNKGAAFFEGMVPDDMRQRMTDLKKEAEDISADVKTVAKQAQDLSQVVLATDAGAFSDRLAALEAKLATMDNGQALKDLTARIRNLEVSEAGQGQLDASIAELSKIVDSMDGRVNTLDQKLAQSQASPDSQLGQTLAGVSTTDLKAAALLIAFSQLRDSLNRNAPFEGDVVLLQKLVGNDNPELQEALSKLAPQADKGGVLTSEGLSNEFKTLGSDIVFASLKGEDVSVTDKAKVRFGEMFNVKKDGEPVGGTETQKIVAKAQAQLDANDVQGAIQTLDTLKGDARQTAAPFVQQAESTMLADQIQTMLRQMIVANVGTANGTPDLGAVKDAVQNALPGGQGVVKDDASGMVILPSPKGFKGFSTTPQE